MSIDQERRRGRDFGDDKTGITLHLAPTAECGFCERAVIDGGAVYESKTYHPVCLFNLGRQSATGSLNPNRTSASSAWTSNSTNIYSAENVFSTGTAFGTTGYASGGSLFFSGSTSPMWSVGLSSGTVTLPPSYAPGGIIASPSSEPMITFAATSEIATRMANAIRRRDLLRSDLL